LSYGPGCPGGYLVGAGLPQVPLGRPIEG